MAVRMAAAARAHQPSCGRAPHRQLWRLKLSGEEPACVTHSQAGSRAEVLSALRRSWATEIAAQCSCNDQLQTLLQFTNCCGRGWQRCRLELAMGSMLSLDNKGGCAWQV